MAKEASASLIREPAGSTWRGPVSRLTKLARAKPLGTISLLLLIVIWGMVLLSPVLTPYQWDDLFTGPKLTGPTFEANHYFGTDNTGRDVFARVLSGGRLTLGTSLLATIGALTLASIFGILSGYVLGIYDLIFQRFADGLQALPALVVLMVVAAVFEQSRAGVLIVLMILQAPVGGRILRSETLKIRNLEYIEAARTAGATDVRIILRHVLPNVAPLMIVVFSISVGFNMLLLTSLSFLGVVDPSTPDWGGMLNVAAQTYLVAAPWTAIFPGAAITVSVLAYNLLGDALRDIYDPRLRGA